MVGSIRRVGIITKDLTSIGLIVFVGSYFCLTHLKPT